MGAVVLGARSGMVHVARSSLSSARSIRATSLSRHPVNKQQLEHCPEWRSHLIGGSPERDHLGVGEDSVASPGGGRPLERGQRADADPRRFSASHLNIFDSTEYMARARGSDASVLRARQTGYALVTDLLDQSETRCPRQSRTAACPASARPGRRQSAPGFVHLSQPEQSGLLLPAASLLLGVLGDEVDGRGRERVCGRERQLAPSATGDPRQGPCPSRWCA